MLIGGLQKTSLLDYPDKVSAVVFTAGCPFRCGFCHNPELVTDIDPKTFIPESEVLEFLTKRRGVLDAVVITGGEPTLQRDLPEFIAKLRALGYLIKLDTNGTNPLMVQRLLDAGALDYLAMDIKAPLEKYDAVAGRAVERAAIEESIRQIMQSGVPYEFRSTVLPAMHTADDIVAMARLVQGARAYYLQAFRPADGKLIDPTLTTAATFSPAELETLAAACRPFVEHCGVR